MSACLCSTYHTHYIAASSLSPLPKRWEKPVPWCHHCEVLASGGVVCYGDIFLLCFCFLVCFGVFFKWLNSTWELPTLWICLLYCKIKYLLHSNPLGWWTPEAYSGEVDGPVPLLEMTLFPASQTTVLSRGFFSVNNKRRKEKREAEWLAKPTDPQSEKRSNIKVLSQDLSKISKNTVLWAQVSKHLGIFRVLHILHPYHILKKFLSWPINDFYCIQCPRALTHITAPLHWAHGSRDCPEELTL